MDHKLTHYSILEINEGETIFRKDLVENVSFKLNKNDKSLFIKSIVDSAILSNIGIINLMNEEITGIYSYYPSYEIPLDYILTEFIIEKFGNTPIAKNIPIPYGKKFTPKNSKSEQRNERFASLLAIDYYLENKNSLYIEDLSKLKSVIKSFYDTYIDSNRIKFIDTPLLKDTGSSNETFNSQVIKGILQYITNYRDIDTFYLYNISNNRSVDFSETSDFVDFKVVESLNEYEAKLYYESCETLWNDNFLESLKLISKNTKTKLFMQVKYDYPFTEGDKLEPI